ncbi:hypothetical protein L1049_018896 [Liquidambar formosana]|uniref:Uncharacterized protein n=1 Tax=Liquidambar formosana TaxID=63359 RepID=A0AAP0RBP0_LIQFO
MARPSQDAIHYFMNITGASEPVAVQKLEEYGGDLNGAVNAHFNQGNRHNINSAVPRYGFMDAENQIQAESRGSLFSLLSAARSLNPFSLLDPNYRRRFFNGLTASALTSRAPLVSHPREVMGIPIGFGNTNGQSSHSEVRPSNEDVTGTAFSHGPEEYNPYELNHSHLYGNDVEKEMIQAAIDASMHEAEEGYQNKQLGGPNGVSQRQLHLEDDELARAVSLSLKTAEEEKAVREYINREQMPGCL